MKTVVVFFILIFMVTMEIPSICYGDNYSKIAGLEHIGPDEYICKSEIIKNINANDLTEEEKKIILKSFDDDTKFKKEFIEKYLKEGMSVGRASELFNNKYNFNDYSDILLNTQKLYQNLECRSLSSRCFAA